MSDERIAEVIAALKLGDADRVMFNVNMGQAKDALVIVEGDQWVGLVHGRNGWVMKRRGTFKAE